MTRSHLAPRSIRFNLHVTQRNTFHHVQILGCFQTASVDADVEVERYQRQRFGERAGERVHEAAAGQGWEVGR